MNDIRSTATSPANSPLLTPRTIHTNYDPKQEEAAIKLLSFGQESVEMLHSVSSVFSDTVDRAELWIDRLKMVPGMNKGSTTLVDDMTLDGESVKLPPIRLENNTIPPPANSFDHHHNKQQQQDR